MIAENEIKAPGDRRLTSKQKLDILKRLYAAIPEMDCFPACTACCGHVAWSRFEWFRLPPAVRADYNFFRLGCDFVKHGKCSIYPHRPFMCRIFGTVAQSEEPYGQIKNAIANCPRGVAPERRLTVSQAKKLTTIYWQVFFKEEGEKNGRLHR